jgi:hypothetical protein
MILMAGVKNLRVLMEKKKMRETNHLQLAIYKLQSASLRTLPTKRTRQVAMADRKTMEICQLNRSLRD